MEIPLQNVVTKIVLPAEQQQPRQEDELSDLDLMMVSTYTPLLLLFDRPPALAGTSFSSVVDGLKDSLSRTLVSFYPLAGRVVKKAGEVPRLLYNDAGAVFTSAQVDAPMRQICNTQGDFQALPVLTGLAQAGLDPVRLLQQDNEISGLPCLVVQVTGFRCGGIGMAVNWNHVVADAYSGVQFVKSWSELSRGMQQAEFLPGHGRSQLLQEPQFLAVPGTNYQDQHGVVWISKLLPLTSSISTSDACMKQVEYSEEAIERLKKHVSGGTGTSFFSTVDCIAAHLWKSVTKARFASAKETDPRLQQAGRYTTVVDARRRKLVASSYFGNAVSTFGSQDTTPGELMAQPVQFAASLVQQSVASATLDSFRFLSHLVQRYGRGSIGMGFSSPGRDFGTSCWNGFPLYQLQFFHHSRPLLAMRNGLVCDHFDNFAFLLPSSASPRSITVLLYATKAVLHNLLSDTDFTIFAEA